MLKSIVLCALLSGFALSAEPIFERANISVMKLLHSRNLFTVKLKDHLFGLTWKNSTHVEVFSTNKTKATEECTFDTREYPLNQLDPSVVLNTAVLGDNQTIAAVGFRHYLSNKNDKLYRYAYYNIFLLNLINCTFKEVVTAHLSNVSVSYPEHQPQIVAHDLAQNNSFDVFFDSEEPQRYSGIGEKIALKHKLKIDFDEEFDSFHVRLLDPVNTERNYLYIHNFRNGTAVMKVLNRDFDVTTVKGRLAVSHVKNKVDFLSVNKDAGSPIGVCYFSNGDKNRLFCDRFDFYLNPVLTFEVKLPYNCVISNVTITLDHLGNTFVGVLHNRVDSSQKRLVVFRYNLHGKKAEALDLGYIDNGNTNLMEDRVVQLDSYIVEGMQGQYCVVAYEVLGATTDHHYTHMKCFQAPKDNKTEE